MPGSHPFSGNPRYTVSALTGVEVYRIGNEAIITLQPSTGYVAVSCAWHDELNGCHYWNSRGRESLYEFLITLDRSYTLGKLFDSHALQEYDEEATKAGLRKLIIECRRDGSWTAEEARDVWDQVARADGAGDIARLEGMDCPYESLRYSPKACADWFWTEVWSAFINHLKTNPVPPPAGEPAPLDNKQPKEGVP